MDIFPDWIGPTGTGDTVYVEVPDSLQGGRVWKHIVVSAKVKMKKKKKNLKVVARLIDK